MLSWDLPPLVVAHLVAGVALARASQLGQVEWPAIGLGLLAILVGLWRRNRIWGEAGNVLILWGAAAFGPQWLALALLLTSIRSVISAILAIGPTRIFYQSIAAVTAGWSFVQVIVWRSWSIPETVSVSAMVFGGMAAIVAVLVRFVRLPRDWALTWGGLAVLGTVATTVASPGYIEGPGLAIGTGLFALASALAARVLSPSLHYLAVVATGWGWWALALGLEWSSEASAFWTAIAFGVLSVALAELARALGRRVVAVANEKDRQVELNSGRAWGLLCATGVIVGSLIAIIVDRRELWLVITAALALLSFAAGRAAIPLRWLWLREASGLLLLGSATALTRWLGLSSAGIALLMMGLGLGTTIFLLWFGRRFRSSVWLPPLMLTGASANLEALFVAVALWPRRDIIVFALLAFGIQALAVGLILERPGIAAVGPPLILIAWLGVAAESFTGSAQWYTAPAAVTLLVEIEIGRWSVRGGRAGLGAVQLRFLEWVGMGLLAISPLAEMFSGGVFFGLLAFGYAAVILIWGVLTRVRRRLVAALVLATVAAALTISAGAASAAPASAFFWIIAAGAGLAVMLSIGIVESYRSRSGAIMHRLDLLMEGWE